MWKECERVKQKGGATGERNGEEGPGGELLEVIEFDS